MFFLFSHIAVTVNAPPLTNSKGIKISKFLSLPVGGDLESVSIISFDEDSSEGASMCAITSIPSSACNAKAFIGDNKAIRNKGINIKHKYLFSFIFFILDNNYVKSATDFN